MSEQITEPGPALNSALAGEYAAVYAYGLIGAHLTGAAQARARKALMTHRGLRDELRDAITATGNPPPIPAPAYAPPTPVTNPATASALAITVEQRLVRAWSAVASTSADDARRRAARTAQECAVRAMSWGATSQSFPG